MRRFIVMVLFTMLICFQHPAMAQCLHVRDIMATGDIGRDMTPPDAARGLMRTDRLGADLDGNIHATTAAWHTHQGGGVPEGSSLEHVGEIKAAAPVPEPASILLLGSGFLLVGGLWKRRQQQTRK